MQLTIGSRRDADTVTLTLTGEIDLASAPSLQRELLRAESAQPRRIVLDLGGLDFLDSTAIHVLIRAQGRADASGRELVLTDVPAQARRLFTVTQMTAWLRSDDGAASRPLPGRGAAQASTPAALPRPSVSSARP